MGSGDAALPAIVLGRGPTGLGMLRSLVIAGIPTYIACPEDDLATRSRWYRPVPTRLDRAGATRIASSSISSTWNGDIGPGSLEALRGTPFQQAVVIPGADDAALWLADLPATDLAQRFRVSSSSRQTLQILQDKTRFAAHLAQVGIPHPRTFEVATGDDIAKIPFAELDRVFIKPADSQRFSAATDRKGIWADGRDAFEAAWTRLDAQGFKLIAQEYVPGGSSDHYFIDGFRDRNGNLTGLFARRRLRIHPPDFGNSSYCESIALSDVGSAADDLGRLLAGLDYRGIFSAEFKRDARDGVFRILEVNTRAWWYVEFAAHCGINVCAMAYDDALERPVAMATDSYPVGAGCVNLAGDMKSALSRANSSRPPLMQVLRQWRRAHFHLFRRDDPRPGLWIASGLLRHQLRKLTTFLRLRRNNHDAR